MLVQSNNQKGFIQHEVYPTLLYPGQLITPSWMLGKLTRIPDISVEPYKVLYKPRELVKVPVRKRLMG